MSIVVLPVGANGNQISPVENNGNRAPSGNQQYIGDLESNGNLVLSGTGCRILMDVPGLAPFLESCRGSRRGDGLKVVSFWACWESIVVQLQVGLLWVSRLAL